VLVQDLRRDPQEEEAQLIRWAADRNLYLIVVGTKLDRLNRTEQRQRKERLNELYKRDVILVSNRTGEGMDEVRRAIKAIGLEI